MSLVVNLVLHEHTFKQAYWRGGYTPSTSNSQASSCNVCMYIQASTLERLRQPSTPKTNIYIYLSYGGVITHMPQLDNHLTSSS